MDPFDNCLVKFRRIKQTTAFSGTNAYVGGKIKQSTEKPITELKYAKARYVWLSFSFASISYCANEGNCFTQPWATESMHISILHLTHKLYSDLLLWNCSQEKQDECNTANTFWPMVKFILEATLKHR